MSANTKIEWADHTLNPWIGCTQISPGCANCFAKADFADRKHRVVWGVGQARSRTKTWGDPLKWNAQHEAFYAQHGRRQRVFCASLADVFDNEVDPEWRADLFRLIADTPHLDWLLLTKRIGNAREMISEAVDSNDLPVWPWPHVWIGATIVNQEEADRDIPKLLQVPAAKRFLSMEPLLGPVNLEPAYLPCENWGDDIVMDPETGAYECCKKCDHTGISNELGIDWVIVGGESGPGARPMHHDWARSLRDQCHAAGVPFLFKQWGEWLGAGQDGDHAHRPIELNASNSPIRVGKKAAGRLLDGREWNEVPA